MRFNSPQAGRQRWSGLPQKLMRGFVLGLTLSLALTSAGLMR